MDKAHLNSRPGTPVHQGSAGLHRLQLARRRHALVYVPAGALQPPASPLAVMLHGAGGNADHGMDLLKDYADLARLVVLAPESRKHSWDIISDADYGPDVRFIDSALEHVFAHYSIDANRVAIGGFSDGASYALSLGLTNGRLFRQILAFSPGFMAPLHIEDRPKIFISHGTRDQVLPIDPCSRKIVRLLRNLKLPVDYREFHGPHTIPPEMKAAALELLLSGL